MPAADSDFGPHSASQPGLLALRTVLYADDNALNVELVLAILRTRPELRAVVARNAHEAIAAARRDPPDLMQVLQLDPALAHIPCVALLADAMPAAMERAGFKAYLTKPLNVKLFLQCLDKVLGGR